MPVKAAGWLLGLAVFGGLIVMSIAGVTAAIGVLVTAAAIVGMIALGNLLGGRTTPDRRPYDPEPGIQVHSGDDTASAGGPRSTLGEELPKSDTTGDDTEAGR